MLINILEESLILIAFFSGVPLLVSTALSLLVSFIQATTQIQEQSIGFFVKIVSVAITLFLLSSTFVVRQIDFIQRLLSSVKYVGVE